MAVTSADPSSGVPVVELVRDIRQFSDLRALRLEGNTVGVEAAQTIAKALEDKEMLQVDLQHPEDGDAFKNRKPSNEASSRLLERVYILFIAKLCRV